VILAPGVGGVFPLAAARREIRCYLRDPDGHLIEVGQSRR
jgi:catechol 2,3-dioxygenase-like lactoylglutathione lyase family enzyme